MPIEAVNVSEKRSKRLILEYNGETKEYEGDKNIIKAFISHYSISISEV